ncbi:MAG: bacillithiol biosynthesis deacetylase BshB1 [Gemmatimonadetes bacterium]|nr:bacillithiol biosynthesis deacetylase BshB1 [Gemmatimonadota bacterium]NNM06997.1 bacillithiol biosynthesis deacetylase BshB1 [Gemmatimonadota bacterium]
MEPLDLLAVVAHPDDAELICGGSLLVSKDRGERTGVLDLTRGEMGSQGSPELRAREAEAASERLGLAVRRNAGLPDARLQNTPETRVTLAGILRELRPRVVITHWLQGRHPDHRAAAELVYDTAYLAGLTNFPAEGSPFRPFKVVHALSFREEPQKPTFVVDISDQMDRKLAAVAAYSSQFGGAVQAGEVFPGGGRALEEQIRAHAARVGSLIRVEYGEPFWTRETVQVPSLGSLSVSTF